MPNDASAVALRDDDHPALLSSQQMAALDRVIFQGDLSQFSEDERRDYYFGLCRSERLNPLTKPFEYIVLDRKLTLYALKNCTDQLRARDRISTRIVSREVIDGIYVVTAQATAPDGRTEESTGAVPLSRVGGTWQENQRGKSVFRADGTVIPLTPDDRANAYLKCETKAKRRVTLSMCALPFMDESELDTISRDRIERPRVDHMTGRITEVAPVEHIRPAPDVASPRDRREAGVQEAPTTPAPATPSTRQKQQRTVKQDGTVVDTETGEIVTQADDDTMTWTALWAWAREHGFSNNRTKVEEFLGFSFGEMSPGEVKRAITQKQDEQGATAPQADDETTQAMKRLHAIGAARDLTHDHLHLLGWALGVDSLTRLTSMQLIDLGDWIEENGEATIAAEINAGQAAKDAAGASDAPMDSTTADWLASIDGTGKLTDLEKLEKEMREQKVKGTDIWSAFAIRRESFLRMGG